MFAKSLTAAALSALLLAAPAANAAVTVVVGPGAGDSSATFTTGPGNNTATFNFNGFSGNGSPAITGLTSTLALTLLGRTLSFDGTSTLFSFGYKLSNTNTDGITSRVSSFGFNSNPELKEGFYVSGPFELVGSGNLSSGNNKLDFCLKNGTGQGNNGANNCSGGNNGGPTNGNFFEGSFDLEYDGDINSIMLSDFGVRYQSITGAGSVESGIGRPIMSGLVPEPATWAMMILGFGLIGGALRSRKAQAVRVTYA